MFKIRDDGRLPAREFVRQGLRARPQGLGRHGGQGPDQASVQELRRPAHGRRALHAAHPEEDDGYF